MNRVPHIRRLVVVAHAGLAGSLAGTAALHVGWAEQVDAVRNVFSDYALSDGAYGIFAGTVACLSVGSTALVAGLVRSGLPVGAPVIALLGAWCGGLALAVVFRTDPPGDPSLGGLVHRYAAGGAVAALPAAVLLMARRLGRRPGWETTARSLRRISWASVGGLLRLHVRAPVRHGLGPEPAGAADRRPAGAGRAGHPRPGGEPVVHAGRRGGGEPGARMTWLAIILAILNACCFTVGTWLQHGASAGGASLASAVRRPRWLAGLALLALGAVCRSTRCGWLR